MAHTEAAEFVQDPWGVHADPPNMFSSGIADLDRLLDGGFPRGTMALFSGEASVGPQDLELLLTPLFLNFLMQSNGVLAVLPSRQSPQEFRAHLTRSVTRKLFDTRVRIVDYVGESEPRPYVVPLRITESTTLTTTQRAKRRGEDLQRMTEAETAIRGARGRMFLEYIAFEIMDMVVGPEKAAQMFFHGIKRTRSVGNLCVGVLRPGVGCSDAVRGMADRELAIRREELGLVIRGIRPAFPEHLVVPDRVRGLPSVSFVPTP